MTAMWLTLLILSFIAARRDWHRLREQIAAPLYLGCDTCALCGKPMTEHRNKDGQFYPAGMAPGAWFMCPC
jgi:hypothetical protein